MSKLARGILVSLFLFVIVGCQGLSTTGPGQNQNEASTGQAIGSVRTGSNTSNVTTRAQLEVTVTPVVQQSVLLFGDTTVLTGLATVPVGVAQSFQYVATATGVANEINIYLDGRNGAGRIVIGLYSNSAKNHPDRLLAEGRIDSPRAGTWNTVAVTPISLMSREKYWLTVLVPFGTADALLGLAAPGGLAELSSTAALKQLIATWVPGATQNQGTIAAYVLQTGTGQPTISSVSVAKITDDTATITWSTDRPASSQVRYGTTTAYGDETTNDPTLVVSHTQVLGALTPNTPYDFQVSSADPNGQSVSANNTFMTGVAATGAAQMGEWSSVMPWPLVDVHMSLLRTGEVLMWDAWELGGTASVHLWNPNSQSWSPAFQTLASVPTADAQMFCAGQTMLPDGRILVVGGYNGADVGIKNTMVYDPSTRQWTPVSDMNTARWYPTSIGLPNGRVIALGGEITLGVDAVLPEVYDPARDVWQPLPRAALDIGQYPLSYLLPNGQIFIAAGVDDKARTLNLASQTWTTLGVNPAATGTAAMYQPGKILVSGGGTHGADPVQSTAATIELTQTSPAWTPTAPMIEPRYKHSLVVLADGTVLAVGGSSIYSLVSQKGVLDAEMWNPTTGDWTLMAPMHNLRMYHSTALLLPDGRVLAAGGGRMSPVTDYQTAEIYSPPYLFKGARPTITAAPTSASIGSTISIQTPDAAQIKSIALVRLGSVTHTFDSDQRYVNLTFTQSNGGLEAKTPASANVAPPGYYMLFILNTSGVPSVAKIVKLS
jgi:hypothetical protein